MATWRDIAVESERAARVLLREDAPRSCLSRAYYAAYAGVRNGLDFAGVKNDPSHAALPGLVGSTFSAMSVPDRRRVRTLLRRLYAYRVMADYTPGAVIDKVTAREGVAGAASILWILGIEGRTA